MLTIVGVAAIVIRSSRSDVVHSGRLVLITRRLLQFVASVYAIVIAVLLVWGPFMFELGPLRVQASTFRKPVQIVTLDENRHHGLSRGAF